MKWNPGFAVPGVANQSGDPITLFSRAPSFCLPSRRLSLLPGRFLKSFPKSTIMADALPEMDDEDKELENLERILIDASVKPTRLSYALLKKITNNFSQEIGSGGFGVVYMGVLQNGKVAVKKLSKIDDFSEKQFMDELTCLISVNDKNIVRFLGYCSDTQGEVVSYNGQYVVAEVRRRLLCFEYVPNKSLHDYLKDQSRGCEWNTRYQLIGGICRGVRYLHKERINHLDLKPENILLDANMVPKITDFGLSRRFGGEQSRMITKHIFGSLGYTAPEYRDKGEISFKADIYSLGIIIIKLLRGSNELPDNENWHESLDIDCPEVKKCIEIARICADVDQHKRPNINYIIDKLNGKETMIQMVSPVFGESRTEQCSSLDQASSDSMELLGIDQRELHFPFQAKKQIPCSLQLTNKTDGYVAFRFRTTNTKMCSIKPNLGILLPKSTSKVIIHMQAQNEAPPDMQCIFKILIQSTRVSHGLTDRDITGKTFNKEMGKIVEEVKLEAFSVTPPQLLREDMGTEESDTVLTLDAANFDSAIAKHSFIVIEFYAPRFEDFSISAAEYEKATQVLSKNDPPIVLAKLDARDENNRSIATKLGVKVIPTIKIMTNQGNDIQTYDGPRDAESIVEYMRRQVRPASF